MTEASFQHWWQQFLQGNQEAFGKLYQPFHRKLTLYCFRYVHDEAAAEDLAAEALYKLYEYPEVASVRDFERWLFTAAKNLCLDQIRKDKRRGEIREEIRVGTSTGYRPEAEKALQAEEYERWVAQVLSEKELEVWELHQQGFANEEIAEKVGTSAKTAANLKSMARNKLRDALKQHS